MPEPDEEAGLASAQEQGDQSEVSIEQSEDEEESLPEDLPLKFVILYLTTKNEAFHTFLELFIYLPFLAFVTVSLLGSHGIGGEGLRFTTSASSVLSDAEWDNGPGLGFFESKSWGDVKSTQDIFRQFTSGASWAGNMFNQPKNYVLNKMVKIIGPIRFSQYRSKSFSNGCLRDFAKPGAAAWKACHLPYSKNNENKSDFADINLCGSDFPLGRLGVSGFRHYDSFRQTPLSDYPGMSTFFSGGLISGSLAEYPTDSGFIFDVHPSDFPIEMTEEGAPAEFQLPLLQKFQCIQENWIDPATRAVRVSVFLYNQNEDLFLQYQLLAEFATTGTIVTSTKAFVFAVGRPKGVDIWVELMVVLYVIYFLLKFIWDVTEQRRNLLRFLTSIWTFIDAFNLIVFVIGYAWRMRYWILPQLEFAVSANTPSVISKLPANEQQYYLDLATFERLSSLAFRENYLQRLGALNGLLCYLKVFKFLGIDPHFSLLTDTVREVIAPLLSLIIYCLFMIFGVFMMTMQLYGSTSPDFSSFGNAMNTILQILLGAMNYQNWMAIDHTWTPVFFMFHTCSVWLVVLNLVIGIITDGFVSAKKKQEASVLPVNRFFQQKWVVQAFQYYSPKFLPWHSGQRPKNKSAIRWGKIHGVPLGRIVNMLATYLDMFPAEEQSEIVLTLDTFLEMWETDPISRRTKQNPKEVALALFRTLCAQPRESTHTAAVKYEETEEDLSLALPTHLQTKEETTISFIMLLVIEAQGLPDVDVIGSREPYVRARIGNDVRRTLPIADTVSPCWDEYFEWEAPLCGHSLEIAVVERDVVGQQIVGAATLDLEQIPSNTRRELWLTLRRRGNVAGRLRLRVEVSRFGDAPPVTAVATGTAETADFEREVDAEAAKWKERELAAAEARAVMKAVQASVRRHLFGLVALAPLLRTFSPRLERHICHTMETLQIISRETSFWHAFSDLDVDKVCMAYDPMSSAAPDDPAAMRKWTMDYISNTVLALADDWSFNFNLPRLLPVKFPRAPMRCFPQHVLDTDYEPDIAIWSQTMYTLVAVSFVMPTDKRGGESLNTRYADFLPTQRQLHALGWTPYFVCFEVTGIKDPNVRRFFTLLSEIRDRQDMRNAAGTTNRIAANAGGSTALIAR
eukprot:TRINITY_DN27529_c0_g1_i1.p1 TRINITY_DN27529_c0_g1~~TRINITY_DN27529_c0_g1_i1.p1  ORF type:complete len:1134 (+),score=157.65 TRINITY_DN27529_c0_g1_i1:19-3420(+)